MDPEIRAAVLGDLGGDRPVEAATLAGYRRVILRRRRYPAIVDERSSSVAGFVSGDLNQRAVDKLDAFETEEYDRIRCTVSVPDGKTIQAWTYVAGRLANPTPMSWNLAAWQRNHKRELLRSLRGWRA